MAPTSQDKLQSSKATLKSNLPGHVQKNSSIKLKKSEISINGPDDAGTKFEK